MKLAKLAARYLIPKEGTMPQGMGSRVSILATMDKIIIALQAATSWLAVADTYSQHRDDEDRIRATYKYDYLLGREQFRAALVTLDKED